MYLRSSGCSACALAHQAAQHVPSLIRLLSMCPCSSGCSTCAFAHQAAQHVPSLIRLLSMCPCASGCSAPSLSLIRLLSTTSLIRLLSITPSLIRLLSTTPPPHPAHQAAQHHPFAHQPAQHVPSPIRLLSTPSLIRLLSTIPHPYHRLLIRLFSIIPSLSRLLSIPLRSSGCSTQPFAHQAAHHVLSCTIAHLAAQQVHSLYLFNYTCIQSFIFDSNVTTTVTLPSHTPNVIHTYQSILNQIIIFFFK